VLFICILILVYTAWLTFFKDLAIKQYNKIKHMFLLSLMTSLGEESFILYFKVSVVIMLITAIFFEMMLIFKPPQ
jgi:hypothetical protein